ncbi:unnamed protein product [Dracunculus medinensis]|uniref:Vacuolar protein sorting-associated protein 16 homolog n=1 Tax=Dracunculus medinensis TaxID=318479 RepID=A0A3P7PMY0_DRAME|nr:unnamed protein product [Dracunculus medinensis]
MFSKTGFLIEKSTHLASSPYGGPVEKNREMNLMKEILAILLERKLPRTNIQEEWSENMCVKNMHNFNLFLKSCSDGLEIYQQTAIANLNSSGSLWTLVICTCSGYILSTLKVANLSELYWTRCHRLVIVGKIGQIFVYSPRGKLLNQFAIDKDLKVIDSRIFYGIMGNTGLAVLTENGHIFALNSVIEAVPWRIRDISRADRPSAWTVLLSTSGQTTILLIYGDDFYAAMQGVALLLLNISWKLSGGEYIEVVPNWDYTRIAFVHSSGLVQLVNSDLTLISTIVLSSTSFSSKLLWCGSNAIAVMETQNSLKIISSSSVAHVFDYTSDIRIDTELDGIKVFTRNELIFISCVPDELVDVIGIASTEAGAILYEASQKLEKGTPGVYEYLNLIEDNMDKAYQQCLIAAAHQFSPESQKKLLKAASLGKSLLRRQDTSQFVDICRVIRVLNFIRQPHIGFSLSFPQSSELKMRTLIDRLIDMEHWPLAISICDYMKIPIRDGVHRVLAHWAVNKIEKVKMDKESGKDCDFPTLTELIANKFANHPEVSFAGNGLIVIFSDVAMKAVEAGLNEMAELLLEKETRLNRQVEMLLKLNKVDKALAKAAKSQQPDLLHIVLSHLKRTQKKEIIDHLVLKLPQAMCLYQDYLREEAPPHVYALYVQKDDFIRQAIYLLDESEITPWNPFEIKDKTDILSKAKKCLQNIKDCGSVQILAEAINFFHLCENWNSKVDCENVDRTSVRSVFIWAAGNNDDYLVEQLKKSFKLSEKQCVFWKIEAYASYKKWNHLDALSLSKKLPFGFMPFVEACARYGEHQICENYISKLSSAEEIVEGWLLIEQPVKAANYAASKNMVTSVEKIYSRYRMEKEISLAIEKILLSLKMG